MRSVKIEVKQRTWQVRLLLAIYRSGSNKRLLLRAPAGSLQVAMKQKLRRRLSLIGLVVGLSLLGLSYNRSATQDGNAGASKSWPVVTVDLTKLGIGSTAVAYNHSGEPPWNDGNCLTFGLPSEKGGNELRSGEFKVANLFAENFEELKKRFSLTNLQVQLLESNVCLVVDKQIPSTWLRETPCGICLGSMFGRAINFEHPQHFRSNPKVDALANTRWKLAAPITNGVLLGAMPSLWGTKVLEFSKTNLVLRGESDAIEGDCLWDLNTSTKPDTEYLTLRQLAGGELGSGIGFELIRRGPEIELTPRTIFSLNGTSGGVSSRSIGAKGVGSVRLDRVER